MRRRSWLPIVLTALLGASTGLGEPGAEGPPSGRRLLDKWRADPERLQRELRALRELPPERQERLRRLDRELHDADPETRKRLWAVLGRYSSWVERLPEEDRQRLLAADGPLARLAVIKDLRGRQWVDRLPAPKRDQLRKMPAAERSKWVAQMRRQEREQRTRWQSPPKGEPRPAGPDQLPPAVRGFLDKQLRPRLSADEKQQLKKAEGNWPQYPRTVWRLAWRHPVLPPKEGKPVLRYEDLPPEVKKMLPPKGAGKAKLWDELKKKERRWPDFALEVTRLVKQRKHLTPPPLGASRPAEFPPAMRAWIENWIEKRLDVSARKEVKKLEGRWPEYPLRLHELARERELVIPGMSLPGPTQLWRAAWMAGPPALARPPG
jgi:hypothetical protein